MIAVVTGANGFIGRTLTARLAQLGWRVRAVVRRDHARAPAWLGEFPRDAAARVEWLATDYADATQLAARLAQADVVIHAAGATRAPTIAALRAANVGVTEQVLAAAARAGVGRVVFVSSQAAAGPAAALDRPVTECDQPAPVEAYGQSKYDAERLVAASRLPFAIVRPAAVYGPADADFLAVFRLAQRGIALHPANRAHWLSIIHVRDLIDGILCAATDERAVRGTFFLGNAAPVQWSTFFALAAQTAGTALHVDVELPRPVVDLGALLGDAYAKLTGRASLLTTQKVALSRPAYWVCSSARATQTLGFMPRLSLQDGFRETYHWYVAHGWL